MATYRIFPPQGFATSRWKNGGGVTHEILRDTVNDPWQWRISIAEVASDGPFSRFEGLSRILTVIEGNGLDLHTPDDMLAARRLQPLAFSGDTPVESRMVDGPVRDLNLIYDSRHVSASVEVVAGPQDVSAGPGKTGVLCLGGTVAAGGEPVPAGAFALGEGGCIRLSAGAQAAIVRLQDRQ
ncbi:MAG: HutD family protein [Defluviimonas sp.]|uniref:HutD/Ves family protein n=1 Tax=Albidovulum sp. TaxID=1872424 RepID=UPI002A2FE117|nr:HutD family protein [Defluviimonas sp.]